MKVKESKGGCYFFYFLSCERKCEPAHLLMSMCISYAHKTEVEIIAQLKAHLVLAEATAKNLETLKTKTSLLSVVQSLLGKRCSSSEADSKAVQ